MRRRKSESPAEPAAIPVPQPVAIEPTGVYQLGWVRQHFLLRKSSLRREIKEGRLAVCKRCGRYYFLGQQLLDWLRAGEVVRRPTRNGSTSKN